MRRAWAGAVALVLMAGVAAGRERAPLRDAVLPSAAASPGAVAWTDPAGAAGDAPISTSRAVLYSLLLPGLGDYKLGHRGRATAFFVAEGAIWTSFAAFQVQGHRREDEYQDLAVRFAGVDRTGHSDEFYATIRGFDSSVEYEADVKLQGRFDLLNEGTPLEGIGADALDAYFVENRVSDYAPWQWSSFDRRLQYSEVRSSSKTAYRRADYMIAAAAANRVVSAVVVYAASRSLHRSQPVGYRIDFTPRAEGVDVTLVLTRSF